MADRGSNSVSIVAILAIVILVGLVLYLVFRPAGDGELELDVDITMLTPAVMPPTVSGLRVYV